MTDPEKINNKDKKTRKMAFFMVVILVIGILIGVFVEEIFGELAGDDEDENENMLLSFITNDPYEITVDPSDYSKEIDNPYFPMTVGNQWVYTAETEDGTELTEVEVLNETKTVMGIECTVVRDTVYLDGSMIEDTRDWFAQDINGNVWYMGEDTAEYEDGVLLNRKGAWEAGVDGALPGIYMWANPLAGTTYRQEYYKGHAEDMATVLSVGTTETIGYGTYENVLVTKDFIPGDPEGTARKYYAPGIGNILELEGDERVELIKFTNRSGNSS